MWMTTIIVLLCLLLSYQQLLTVVTFFLRTYGRTFYLIVRNFQFNFIDHSLGFALIAFRQKRLTIFHNIWGEKNVKWELWLGHVLILFFTYFNDNVKLYRRALSIQRIYQHSPYCYFCNSFPRIYVSFVICWIQVSNMIWILTRTQCSIFFNLQRGTCT